MSFRNDTLLLLPQKKEICFKAKNSDNAEILPGTEFFVDISGLYTTELYVRKRWKMFVNRTIRRIYVLTGTVRLRYIKITGNVQIYLCTPSAHIYGSAYISLPLYYTSDPDFTKECADISAFNYKFTVRKTVGSAQAGNLFLSGDINIY